METEKLKEKILSLRTTDLAAHATRRHEMDEKMVNCPHCSDNEYVRYGKDNGYSAIGAGPAKSALRIAPIPKWRT